MDICIDYLHIVFDRIQYGDVVIVMLGGGDKSTQQQDIDRAIKLSKILEN